MSERPPHPPCAPNEVSKIPSRRTVPLLGVLGVTVLLLLAVLSLGSAAGFRPAPNVPPATSPPARLSPGGVASQDLASVPLSPNPPAFGFHLPSASWLAYDSFDQAYYVAAPNSSVDIINASSPTLAVNFTVSVGQDPFGVAVDWFSGIVFVTNSGSDNVSVLQGDQTTPIATVAVGDDPTGIVWDIANNLVYVANSGSNTVSVIAASGTNYSVVSTLNVGLEPLGVAVANEPFSSHGPMTSYVFVANEGSSTVYVINGSMPPFLSYVLTTVGAGDEPYGVAYDNWTNDIYVTNQGSGNVSVISAASFQTVANIPVIGSAGVLQGIAYDSGSRTVWAGAGTLYAVVLDPGNETVAAYVGVDPSGVTYNSDNGNVCVTNAGNQTFECISFPNSVTSPTVNLSFNESGLPSGQPWSVTIGPYGPTQNSTTSQIEVQVLPGQAYAYQVGTLDPLYYASPSSGTVAVPSSTTVSVSFFPYNASQAPASVSFQEDPLSSPLPYDTSYWVDIDGLSLPGTSVVPGDVNFTLGPGDYTWTVLPINGYSVAPFTSSLYVSGPGTQIVNLSFFAIGNSSLPVQFTATGLPADAYWGLDIPGLSNGGQTGPTLSFGMRAGAYNFTVGPPAGFSASPSYGVFNVYGGLLNIVISFSGNGTIYPVTFNETGLPSGALWSVEMDGEWQETSASGLLFYEPNGTYSFEVYDGNGSGPYVPNPSSGVVDLDGAGASVAITFGSAPVTFPVLFVETGLVFGTVWSVTFFNSTYGTDGTTLNASAPNGTYSFTVGNVSGYSPNPASGTVTIAGAALAVNISFSTVPAAEQFAVDVVESGLPSGSDWTATLNGTSYNSTTPTIVFIESNGTYTLDVFATSANYTANYSSPVAVDGAAVAVGVTFSANTYLVTFLESGLAAGTSWTVTAVDEATQVATPGQSNGAEIALRLPEGTYGLTATGPTGDRVSITPSSLDVNGASPSPVTVAYTSLNPGGVAPGALPIPLVVEAGVITLLLASLAAAWGYSSYRYGRRRAEGEEWVRELQAEARETDDPRIRSYSAPHAPTVAAPRRGRRTRRRTTHPPSRPPYGPIGMTTGWAELLAAAAVGGAAGWLGNYLWTHRRAPVSLPPGSRPDESSVTAPAPRAGVEPLAAPLSPGATVERADPAPATAASAEEGLGLARRIILHLAGLGRLGYDEVARVGFTQQDMASALSARQGSLVRVLRRLEAAEVLTVDRRHVSGVPRRLKVYRPTSLGESIARDLRHPTDGAPRGTGSPRAPPPVRPSTAGDWVVQRSSTEARHP